MRKSDTSSFARFARSCGPNAAALFVGAGLCAGLGSLLVGCASGQARAKTADINEPVNTGLGLIEDDPGLALPENEELMDRGEFGSVHDQIEESVRQLDVYFANLEIDGAEPVDPDGRVRFPLEAGSVDEAENAAGNGAESEPVERVTLSDEESESPSSTPITQDDGDGVRVSLMGGSDIDDDSDGDESEDGSLDIVEAEVIAEYEDVATDPHVRKQQLVQELAEVLTELAETSDEPGAASLALTSLEAILSDNGESLMDQGVLSEAEQTSLDAFRTFLQTMSSEGEIVSPGDLAAGLEDIQLHLNQWAGLQIKQASLCTRVDGYGRYETFPSYRFVAGRSQPAIVYVELERFAQRERTGPDGLPRFETKISQRLELYHVADDLNTWNRAAETVGDESRNRLRDYYLINQVTLPANLSVGRYHLKVVVRDLVSDRVAEAIIPIEIVSR